MYADDVILFSSASEQILNSLQAFCEDWCLSINIEKTKVLIFYKAGRLVDTHIFVIFGNGVSCTNSFEYLGILFQLRVPSHQQKSNLMIRLRRLFIIYRVMKYRKILMKYNVYFIFSLVKI